MCFEEKDGMQAVAIVQRVSAEEEGRQDTRIGQPFSLFKMTVVHNLESSPELCSE